ncbi:TPA: hypothetical protein I4D56_04265 [Enterobacter kobei]|nr:hypothetical protein F0324_23190 [Enterobacter kobei]QFH89879.1 hypothetical protein FR825_09025 [Enterobacter kobei]HAS1545136.1 hypothetical protein [Enterobacter kobei]
MPGQRLRTAGRSGKLFLKLSVDGICQTCMLRKSNFNDISITHPKISTWVLRLKHVFHSVVI